MGFGKKTAILIMMGTHGYNKKFGIATDRNVVVGAVLMDWLCQHYGGTTKLLIKPTEVNKMLEHLFDDDLWLIVNDVIGALAQYDNIKGMNIIDDALNNMTDNHRDAVSKFRNGSKV